MPTLTVIEELDVLRDLLPSLLPCFIPPVVHQLILECSPETLYRRVILAVALPPHGRGQTELPQLRLIVLGTILRAAIRMMNESRSWALGVERFPERLLHQVRRHPGPHRIPDDLTCTQIFDPCQIQPPFRGGDIWLSRTCAPFRSCDQRFRTPSRRTGHAPFAMHPALQQTW